MVKMITFCELNFIFVQKVSKEQEKKGWHYLRFVNPTLFHVYNHFDNILRLFNVLPNFPFTANETMHDYCL